MMGASEEPEWGLVVQEALRVWAEERAASGGQGEADVGV
jgi:hypothetical protein